MSQPFNKESARLKLSKISKINFQLSRDEPPHDYIKMLEDQLNEMEVSKDENGADLILDFGMLNPYQMTLPFVTGLFRLINHDFDLGLLAPHHKLALVNSNIIFDAIIHYQTRIEDSIFERAMPDSQSDNIAKMLILSGAINRVESEKNKLLLQASDVSSKLHMSPEDDSLLAEQLKSVKQAESELEPEIRGKRLMSERNRNYDEFTYRSDYVAKIREMKVLVGGLLSGLGVSLKESNIQI